MAKRRDDPTSQVVVDHLRASKAVGAIRASKPKRWLVRHAEPLSTPCAKQLIAKNLGVKPLANVCVAQLAHASDSSIRGWAQPYRKPRTTRNAGAAMNGNTFQATTKPRKPNAGTCCIRS